MADDLLLSGGGSTAVASAFVLELAGRLRVLAGEADGWRNCLRHLDVGFVQPPGIPEAGPGEEEAAADRCLETAGRLARQLDAGVRAAAERYGSVERELTDRSERLGAIAGYVLGAMLPVLVVLGLAMLPAAGVAAGAALRALGGREGLRRVLVANKGVLSDPRFVALVRLAVSSGDNAMLGAAHVAPLTAWLSDDRQLATFGRRGAATSVVAVGSLFGLGLRETPVTVRRVSTSRVEAPTSYGELAARIPGSTPGSPQVRVERYASGGNASWIVYVGGTIDTSFTPGREPWDDTSNLNGVAGLSPGSLRATEQALHEAGAEPGDKLLAVGYSQGGIVSTELVRSSGYAPVGLVTFGSPTAGVSLPHGLDDVAVEHLEDVIPALGGMPRGADQGGLDRMLVRRQVLDDIPPRADESLPAHELDRYRDTAREMDACTDARLNGIRQTLAHVYADSEGTVTTWHGTRAAPDR